MIAPLAARGIGIPEFERCRTSRMLLRVERLKLMPRYGSKTHHDHHKRIGEICARYAIRWGAALNSWGNKASLEQICAELDQHKIPIPESWKTGQTESLRKIGVHLNGWSDAIDLGYYRLVVDQIRYSITRQRLIDAGARRRHRGPLLVN